MARIGRVAMLVIGAAAVHFLATACGGGDGTANAGGGGDGGSTGSGSCECPAPTVVTVQCEQVDGLGFAAVAAFGGKSEQDLARVTAIARYKDPTKQVGNAAGFTATHVLPVVGAGKALVRCDEQFTAQFASVTFALP